MPSIETSDDSAAVAVVDHESYIVRSAKPAFKYPDISMAEYLASGIGKHDPSIAALIDPNNNGTLTYGDLHRQSQEFASALLKLGLTKRDFVLFYAENSQQYVVALLGTIYLGLTFCPIPPASGAFELTERIRECEGSVLIFGGDKVNTVVKALNDPEYSRTMSQLKVLVQLECDQPESALLYHSILELNEVHSFEKMIKLGSGQLLKSIPHFPFTNLATDHYFICFTSGTTGKPKGAIHSNRSFVATMINSNFTETVPGEKALIWHPIGHMSGTFIIQHLLHAGNSNILFSRMDIEPMLQAVEQHRLRTLFVTSSIASAMASNEYEKRYDLSSLAMFIHGGSKIAPSVLSKIRKRYQVLTLDIYGATELGRAVGDRNWVEYFQAGCEPGNLGTVLPNVEMKVVDLQRGTALPPGETGEICFRGAPCFIGYLNNEEATQSTIDAQGWYHSGDVGHFNEKGYLFLTDRIKEMIKYQLYSLIPAEIEDFLHRHEAVEAVCVVGVPHVADGNHIRAYVKVIERAKVTEQELIDYVKENMGSQKRLRAGVQFIAEMPRTLIGKVDRQYFKRLVSGELLCESVE